MIRSHRRGPAQLCRSGAADESSNACGTACRKVFAQRSFVVRRLDLSNLSPSSRRFAALRVCADCRREYSDRRRPLATGCVFVALGMLKVLLSMLVKNPATYWCQGFAHFFFVCRHLPYDVRDLGEVIRTNADMWTSQSRSHRHGKECTSWIPRRSSSLLLLFFCLAAVGMAVDVGFRRQAGAPAADHG